MPRPPATLIDSLEAATAGRRTGLTLLDRHERPTVFSWGALYARAERVAAGLQALGVAPGERVALVFPTSVGFFDAFFGALLAGAVPVPLYPPVRLGRLDEYHRRTAAMIRASGAVTVLAEPRVRRILGETIARSGARHGCRTLEGLPRGSYRRPAARDEDLALVQFSSGTTVEPKPVALSHRAILAQARVLNSLWPDTATVTHRGASWLPLYHDMGLIGCVVPALERRADLTLLPPEAFVTRPALWLRAISRARATISPAPSFAYSLCVHKIGDEELEGVDLSCWRVALNGAERVVPSVMREFAKRFARWGFREEALTPVYGMSEAALAVTFSELDRPPRTVCLERQALSSGRVVRDPTGVELVSVGRPLPGFEVRVGGEGVGPVRVRGPSLMEGYLGMPALTAETVRGGWLETGDLGFVLDGELYLTGRRKDMLLLRGRNHAPEDVEHALDEVEGVRRGCAVAVSWLPEDADGERLLVLVEHRTGPGVVPEALASACGSAVTRRTGLVPDRVVVLPPGTLPRTSSGKLRRADALDRFRSGTLGPAPAVTWRRLASAVLRSTLAYARIR